MTPWLLWPLAIPGALLRLLRRIVGTIELAERLAVLERRDSHAAMIDHAARLANLHERVKACEDFLEEICTAEEPAP